jgi:thiol-disulfide isomerase/thioredoxin
MKKGIFGFLVLFFSTSLIAQGIIINGNLKNLPDSTVVTLLDGMGNKEVATAKAIGGKFVLKSTTKFTSIFIIGFSGLPAKLPLFINNDKIVITGDLQMPNTIQYQGSASHSVYQSYMAVMNPKMEAYFKNLSAVQGEKNEKTKDSLNQIAESQSKDLIFTYENMSRINKTSPVTTFFLFQYANIFPAVKDQLSAYYDMLQGDAKTGPFADVISKTLAASSFGKIGSVMPNFIQNDVNGKPVSLASFKGKYLLVDFWASWCGPCRAENPNVVKAYNDYKAKNFTILSVSLDNSKDKWLEAIKKDGLTWTHVSDLKYWKNEVAVQFGIESIPASFILDPTGKIIARDLRGADLSNFLSKNLK